MNKKRHTIYLDRNVSRALKIYAANTETDMSEITNLALLEFLPDTLIKEAKHRVPSQVASGN